MLKSFIFSFLSRGTILKFAYSIAKLGVLEALIACTTINYIVVRKVGDVILSATFVSVHQYAIIHLKVRYY